MLSQSFLPFDKELILAYLGDKSAARVERRAERSGDEPELEYLDLDRVLLREDGGVILVAEEYAAQQVCKKDGDRISCYMTYWYGSVIVVSVGPNGEMEWAQRIPKSQRSEGYDSDLNSYALLVRDSDLLFIHNDLQVNRNVQRNQYCMTLVSSKPTRKAMVMMATVDGEGDLERSPFIQPEKDGPLLRTKACIPINDKQMLIYGALRKADRFGLVTFE